MPRKRHRISWPTGTSRILHQEGQGETLTHATHKLSHASTFGETHKNALSVWLHQGALMHMVQLTSMTTMTKRSRSWLASSCMFAAMLAYRCLHTVQCLWPPQRIDIFCSMKTIFLSTAPYGCIVHHHSPALCTQVVPLLQGAHVPHPYTEILIAAAMLINN